MDYLTSINKKRRRFRKNKSKAKKRKFRRQVQRELEAENSKEVAQISDCSEDKSFEIIDLQNRELDSSEQEDLPSDPIYQTTNINKNSGMSSMNEVLDWQSQHQIAYWKSRAISLQLENSALHAQIKSLYNKQMEYYVACKEQGIQNEVLQQEVNSTPGSQGKQNSNLTQSESEVEPDIEEVDPNSLPPSEQPGEVRRNEMQVRYGEQAAKLNGMETAIQLNYEHHLKKDKIPYWPNIPLNL